LDINGNISKYFVKPNPTKNAVDYFDKIHNQVTPTIPNTAQVNKAAKVLETMEAVEGKVVELSKHYKVR
jgi:hypothetical protein